jgi:hypothetical protein
VRHNKPILQVPDHRVTQRGATSINLNSQRHKQCLSRLRHCFSTGLRREGEGRDRPEMEKECFREGLWVDNLTPLGEDTVLGS